MAFCLYKTQRTLYVYWSCYMACFATASHFKSCVSGVNDGCQYLAHHIGGLCHTSKYYKHITRDGLDIWHTTLSDSTSDFTALYNYDSYLTENNGSQLN